MKKIFFALPKRFAKASLLSCCIFAKGRIRLFCLFLFVGGLPSAFCIHSFSQTFQRTYGTTGSQTGTCIQHTLDGNYIISAFVNDMYGANDCMLMKITTAGGLLWAKTFGGTVTEKSYYVSTCTDGGYIMSGSTSSFGAGGLDVYLVRTDSNGNLLWSKTVGGAKDEEGWFVVQSSDGGFVTCGGTLSFGVTGWNGYLIKNDSGGNLLWTKVFNGTGGEFFNGMSKTNDGGVIVTGYTTTNSFGASDIWLVKTDFNGDTLWTKQYGKITEDEGWAVIPTVDGGYALTGDMHKDTITPGADNMVLLKTNSAGNMQWVNLYGSNPGAEVGYDLRQTPDSGYVVLGNTNAYGQGSKDILLIRTNSTGGLKWGRVYGSVMQDDAWQFRKTANEGNIIVAATENFAANGVWDIYVVQTDSLGLDSCFRSDTMPEVFVPFLQERSGINIISGGVLNNPNTIVNTVTPQVADPCLLVDVDVVSAPEISVEILPNPFSTSAVLRITNSKNTNYEFKLYDILGGVVMQSVISSPANGGINSARNLIIERGNLAGGIYFYKLESENETSATGKVIIE